MSRKISLGFNVMGAFLIAMTLVLTGCGAKKSSSAVKGSEDNIVYGTSGDGSSTTGGIGLGTLARVHFEFDSSSLSQDARDTLQKNADTIKGNRKMRILVEGHCDERGSNEYNIALGERRSQAVMDYLVNLGVQRSRLEMKSWGEERPLNSGSGETAWKQNRRAEFIILAK